MKDNLIYALYCPINNIPVYIGQSSVGINRPFNHIKEKSHSKKVNEWVNGLKQVNSHPVLVILESEFKEEYLNSKEQYWIQKFLNEGNILLNQQNVSPSFYEIALFNKDNNQDFLSEIRLFIKAKRKMLKLTQVDLAKKAGVGLRFLRELEQGKKDNFSTKSIQKVLMLFGNYKITLSSIINE